MVLIAFDTVSKKPSLQGWNETGKLNEGPCYHINHIARSYPPQEFDSQRLKRTQVSSWISDKDITVSLSKRENQAGGK
jgi:hypothetical protein